MKFKSSYNIIKSFIKDGYKILKASKISSYKIDCEILMSQTLNISREKVLLNLEKNIKKEGVMHPASCNEGVVGSFKSIPSRAANPLQ